MKLPTEASHCLPFERQTELAAFLMEDPFIVERMTDSLWLFRLGYLVEISTKMKSICPIKEKQLKYLLPIIKFEWENTEFWKTCIYPCELHSFPIVKEFLDEIGSYINEYDFFLDFVEWIMSTFGSSAYLSESVFSE